jgi:tetratricopeptide (TPR) repeat protein
VSLKSLQLAKGHHQAGNFSAALPFYLDAVRASPGDAEICYLLGTLYAQLGRFENALTTIRSVNQWERSTQLVVLCANLFLSLKRYSEAIQLYEGAAIRGRVPEQDVTNYCTALIECGRPEEALSILDRHAVKFKDDPVVFFVTGVGLRHLKRFDEALAAADGALALDPKFLEAMVLRTSVLVDQRHHAEALDAADAYLGFYPNSIDLLLRKGNVLRHVGREAEGKAVYGRVLELSPLNPEANYNIGYAELYSGNFVRGWAGYDYRWSTKEFPSVALVSNIPRWEGAHVNRLLIWAEQGIGDQLLFLRFLGAVSKRVGHVRVSLDPKLVGVAQRYFQHLEVDFVSAGSEMTCGLPFDAQLPIADLGKFFIRKQSDICQFSAPCLVSGVFTNEPRTLVGISWRSGNAALSIEKNIDIELFLAGLREVRSAGPLLCLQADPSDRERVSLSDWPSPDRAITFPRADLWNDLLAAVRELSRCRAVVTVSNTNAHLAGAMGIPGVVVVPRTRGRFWYWAYDEDKRSIWYPSLFVVHDIDEVPAALCKLGL